MAGCGGGDDTGAAKGDAGTGATAGSGGNSGGNSGIGGGGAGGNGGASGSGTGASGGSAGVSAGGSGGSGGSGATGGTGSCLVDGFLSSINQNHLLVGASMDDSIASANPFDLRYLYLAGSIPDGSGPCSSCATGCSSQGTSCANSAGCGWWGCWQYDQVPPGAYVRDFVAKAKGDGQIPMFTYYMILPASGVNEGAPEVTKANDAAFMARYYADWKFLLTQIGNELAFLHIEPDFWGYAQQQNDDPTKIPAAAASAIAADCGSLPNTIAGMGQCMVTMTHKYAPNAKVSLHGSGWATKFDVLLNKSASFDVAGEAKKLGQFLAVAGAGADFVTVDAADRDAAWYDTQGQNRWWDATNATLPNFTQAFAWSKGVAEAAGKPILWWQLPVGNMSLPNTTDKWKDNRVDYFMAHMDEVAKGHGLGAAFGAGAGGQTTPSTDGGNLTSKVKTYSAAGGQAPCP